MHTTLGERGKNHDLLTAAQGGQGSQFKISDSELLELGSEERYVSTRNEEGSPPWS